MSKKIYHPIKSQIAAAYEDIASDSGIAVYEEPSHQSIVPERAGFVGVGAGVEWWR